MSSHHIVKDKQEPALMIANGESCHAELLGQLLEWSPYVLVLDGALDRVLMQGIKVDAVLGDFDSLNVQRLSSEMEQEIEWIHIPDQDSSDFDKGLLHLIDKGHAAVNVVWATGRRLDHTYNNLLSMANYSSQLNITLIDDYSKTFVLPKTFKKYYPAQTNLSLLPITDITSIHTSGLLFELTGQNMSIPQESGSSNETTKEGFIEINHEDGILCLMECIDSPAY
jgi:thiamine pyrophosphokinase